MSDPLTTTLRLTQPTVGGDSGTWGTLLNSNWSYVDQAGNQAVNVNVGGLSTYTLTADGSSSDQARYAFYSFTGALTGNCTVTIPSNTKLGLFTNETTGGHNVILTTGSGDTLSIPADGYYYWFWCDGTNVNAVPLGVQTLRVQPTGLLEVGTFNNLSASAYLLSVENPSGGAAQFMNSDTSIAGSSVMVRSDSASKVTLIAFNTGASTVGSVTLNASANGVLYNTTSDRRLKMPVGLITDSARIIDGLKPRLFLWKNRVSDKPEAGFFAQEAARVFPQAVRRGRGKPGRKGFEPWQMDNSTLLPVVIAEMQALRKRVAQLERKLLKAGRG